MLLIDHVESFSFLPLRNPLFHYCNLLVFNRSCASQKIVYSCQNLFFLKIKDRIIQFQLAGIVKNNLRLFKLDSKTLLVCHNVVTSTKWRNMKATTTLTLLEDISVKTASRGFLQNYLWLKDIKLLKPFLAQIVTPHGKKIFRNLILVVL